FHHRVIRNIRGGFRSDFDQTDVLQGEESLGHLNEYKDGQAEGQDQRKQREALMMQYHSQGAFINFFDTDEESLKQTIKSAAPRIGIGQHMMMQKLRTHHRHKSQRNET